MRYTKKQMYKKYKKLFDLIIYKDKDDLSDKFVCAADPQTFDCHNCPWENLEDCQEDAMSEYNRYHKHMKLKEILK